jgi:hypothetical protein
MESTERRQDTPAAMTSPAERLGELLTELVKSTSGSTWVAFARSFGIPFKNEDAETAQLVVAVALPILVRDLAQIRSKLQPEGYPQHLLEGPIVQLRSFFLSCSQMLGADFGNERPKLTSELLRTVEFWAHRLPKDEPILKSVDLHTLWASLRDARESINSDPSLDQAFKDIMDDLIVQLEKALSAYAVGGVTEVRAALRAFYIAAFAARVDIEQHASASSVQKGLAAFKQVWKVAKVAVNLKEVFDLARLVKEHADDAGSALLELMG